MTLSNLEVNSTRQRWCCQWLALGAALREWLWQGPKWVKIHTVHDGNNSMAPQPDHHKQAGLSSFLHVTRCTVCSRRDSATHCLESELHGSSKINPRAGGSHVAVRSSGTTALSCVCHGCESDGRLYKDKIVQSPSNLPFFLQKKLHCTKLVMIIFLVI